MDACLDENIETKNIRLAGLLFEKTMNFAFRLITIFALIPIAYGNKAADKKKTESVKQGK